MAKNIVLCGYHWAGCKALSLLREQGYNVQVFTHDAPYFIADLASYAQRFGVPFSTSPVSAQQLAFKPDLICSIYYRYRVPADVLQSAKFGGVNLHPSLLPRYKGCSSLTWALLNGESETGFTYHYMTERFDGGNILLQKKLKIEDFDLQSTLYQRAMHESMVYFLEVLDLALSGAKGQPQAGGGEYHGRGAPYNGEIPEGRSDEETERFIRAMINPPYPLATYKGQQVKGMAQYKQLKG